MSIRAIIGSGSSPRMRGKRSRSVSGLFRCRIIPAHAGQTPAMPHRAGSSPDHPRACGANMVTLFAETTVIGSSPRMRGKPLPHPLAGSVVRIIPAHAGQTTPCAKATGVSADHPRACGPNNASSMVTLSICGSSPRMRGKLGLSRMSMSSVRIIPAHAGQTAQSCRPRNRLSDHPRACGANSGVLRFTAGGAGSSPRMRGKRPCSVHRMIRARIIPAHAGQTT